MKTLIIILIPFTLLSQGTTHINTFTNQIGVEHYFLEDMSVEASYYNGNGLATLNYQLFGTKDISFQVKWGMDTNSHVTGGIALYGQTIKNIHIGANLMRTFKEKPVNTLGIGFGLDLQIFKKRK